LKRILLAVAGLLVFGLLAGCATLNKQQCEAGDWHGVGVADGENGFPVARFSDHVEACGEHGITPNRELYIVGREEGLRRYCTIRRAEEEGLAGRTYFNVCEGEAGLSFSRVYRQAGDVRDARQELGEASNELDGLVLSLTDETVTDEERVEIRFSILRLQSQIALLEVRTLREEAELRAVVGEESARLARL
jgi:hypothetical protein